MILIIDISNISHMVFHTPSGELTKKDGTPSGVILGTINSIKKYLEMFPEVTRVVACFDKGKSKWRKALYPAYKATRDYGEHDAEKAERYQGLWMQLDELERILPSLGVDVLRMQDIEADDLIACTCKLYPDTPKMIISGDKDLLQMINMSTSVYSPYKKQVIGISNFEEHSKGIPLNAWIGFRALVGDTSDNISGVPGIGETTATNLMKTYGHIDNVLNAQGDDKKKLLKSKRTQRIFEKENLDTLARVNKIINLTFAPYEQMIPYVEGVLATRKEVDTQTIKKFCMDWQYVSLLSNFTPFILTFRALGEDEE